MLTNCLLKALAMTLELMCVLSLNVMELLSCCVGRLCARPVGACVSSDPMFFFDVFPPDICLVCVYEGGYFFV